MDSVPVTPHAHGASQAAHDPAGTSIAAENNHGTPAPTAAAEDSQPLQRPIRQVHAAPREHEELEDAWDADSALDVLTYATSTTTLHESLYSNIQENGRTYHSYKGGKYHAPNDEQEQDRLDLQHAMFCLLFDGRLALAPIDDRPLHNVLDVATGTGIWAVDFADRYPQASVLGTDLTPIQPQWHVEVPPNCRFEVDDAEDDWDYSNPFDYIHGRALLSCFQDPSVMIRKAFANLSPGGYLELQDPIMPMKYASPPPENSPFRRWNDLSLEASIKGGRPWNNVQHYARWMREAGFVDVQEKTFLLPMGVWSENEQERKLGRWQLLNLLQGLEGMSIRNLGRLGWTADECKVLCAEVRREVKEGRVRAYNDIKVVWGRKPM